MKEEADRKSSADSSATALANSMASASITVNTGYARVVGANVTASNSPSAWGTSRPSVSKNNIHSESIATGVSKPTPISPPVVAETSRPGWKIVGKAGQLVTSEMSSYVLSY